MLHENQGRVPGVVQGDPAQAGAPEQPPELVGVPLGMDRDAKLVSDQVLAAEWSACWERPPCRACRRGEMTRSVDTVDQENVTVTLTIAVPAAKVFAVLADPTTHSAIDGTGWVQEAVDRAPLTEVGQIFRINMYHPGHPDGNYQMANKVQVLDPPRAIGWLPGTEKGDGHLEFGGWTWRYDLAPLGPSETEVTLTYDRLREAADG